MVVFSNNSKRIRRPSVRLWEVGDLPAAFTCGISTLNNGSLRHKKWKHDLSDGAPESERIQIASKKQFESTTKLYFGLSSRMSEKCQYNMENQDPSATTLLSEFWIKSKPGFDLGGPIPRRSRAMKRRKRDPDSISSLLCPWKSEASYKTRSEYVKGCELNQSVGCTSETGYSYHSLENIACGMIKEGCSNGIDDQNLSTEIAQRPNESWTEVTWLDEYAAYLQVSYGCNEASSSINSVREWLEALSLGIFADLFEMHEVDEETLPLLTFEDLKDMGIDAVGPRRKLFTAIQQLKRQGR